MIDDPGFWTFAILFLLSVMLLLLHITIIALCMSASHGDKAVEQAFETWKAEQLLRKL